MSNIEIAVRKADARPAIWASDVDYLDVFRLKAPSRAPAFLLNQVSNFRSFGMYDRPDRTMKEPFGGTF